MPNSTSGGTAPEAPEVVAKTGAPSLTGTVSCSAPLEGVHLR